MYDAVEIFSSWTVGLPATVALAAVALIAYMFGQRTSSIASNHQSQVRRELKRAKAVLYQLEAITGEVRRGLAEHHTSLLRFKERIRGLSKDEDPGNWPELCSEAELVIGPTLRLASQVAHAYDELRRQSNQLMSFTETRTDSLTGLSNRQALNETLSTLFSLTSRYSSTFSIAIFDIDRFKEYNQQHGHAQADILLQEVARLLDVCVRDTDVAARYGGEEFIVIMPETKLKGGCLFGERVRTIVEENLNATISVGVATALDGDDVESLLARVDSALYSAKASGRNAAFAHLGKTAVACKSLLVSEADDTHDRSPDGQVAEEHSTPRLEAVGNSSS